MARTPVQPHSRPDRNANSNADIDGDAQTPSHDGHTVPAEPHTPSVESVASTCTSASHDSVFESNTGDVEMSDASSMFSDCDRDAFEEAAPPTAILDTGMGLSMGMDVEMDVDVDVDMATPTTAIKIVPCFGREMHSLGGSMEFSGGSMGMGTHMGMIGVEL